MQVVFITADTVGSPTGGGLVCRHEREALRSLGFDLVTLSRPELNPELYKLPGLPFAFDYLAMDEAYRRFSAPGRKPRLVHIYSGTFSNTVRYFKTLGLPVSYTVAAHSRKESISEFETLYGKYPFAQVKDPNAWRLYSEGVRQADLVIAPSRASASELVEEGTKRVEIVAHGTEIPDSPPALPESFSAGYLGQVGPDKGLVYLIRAWASLGDETATLVLAGDGSDCLAPLVSANADSGRFELLGRVPQARDLYQRISVYVQPSVTEGFGIEIVEAMAHGRPVIASEGAGASEVLTHGEDGFVVPRRDPVAIAKHLAWLKNHPEKLAEMGSNAREKAKSYTWEKARAKYVTLWRDLLA
jgi:glycosyltransferase involved in cell wall biosynthesis